MVDDKIKTYWKLYGITALYFSIYGWFHFSIYNFIKEFIFIYDDDDDDHYLSFESQKQKKKDKMILDDGIEHFKKFWKRKEF